MRFVNTLSLTPAVNDWLANTSHPRILHIFDRACNLINEHREVLSIVTPQIGNAPFNLVIEDEVLFSDHLNIQSPISFSTTQLRLGDLTINTADAKLWNPRPDWERLHSNKDNILDQLQITNYLKSDLDTPFAKTAQGYSTTTFNPNLPITQFSNSPVSPVVSSLSSTLVTIDIPMAKHLASKIAGLGIGLTPSGDDFLVGALYASWIIHPHEIASQLALEISEATAPLTTSLSAAWLRSAGKGETGISWHNLFNSLILPVPNLESPVSQILSTGETSGADALAGFIGTFISYAEVDAKSCPS